MSTLLTRWWRPEDAGFIFPETHTALVQRTGNTGICFSGGGTRAQTCAVGQLRGLHALGLLDRVRYLSSVSGGSWGTTPLLWGDEATSDAALLGPVSPPEGLTLDALDAPIPDTEILHTATVNLLDAFLALWREDRLPVPRLWAESVGTVYLQPFGLHDPDQPAYISGSPQEADRTRKDNPALADAGFVTPRAPGRLPYHVINASGLGPQSLAPLTEDSPVSFEVTPLYGGNPLRHRQLFFSRTGAWAEGRLGGGYLETFALGSPRPVSCSDSGQITVEAPARPYTLADAVGTSSAAFASVFADLPIVTLEQLDPELVVWPLEPDADGERFAMGDGGIIDNYGILSLLRRKVARIVVFINTSTPVDPTYDPATVPDTKVIDEYLSALFGFQIQGLGVALRHNTVLAPDGWAPLVRGLQAAQASGGPVIHRMTHAVRENDFWGIEGGWTVDIAWCYLARVPAWEGRLPAETARAIQKGQRRVLHGALEDFPYYKLIGEDGWGDVHLSVPQARLLSDLCCWCVTEQGDLFRDLLNTFSSADP